MRKLAVPRRKNWLYSVSPLLLILFRNRRNQLVRSEADLAFRNLAGPLPKFSGLSKDIMEPTPQAPPVASSPPPGTGPVRVPPLVPEDVTKFSSLFERSEVQNGLLSGTCLECRFLDGK